MGWYVSLKPSPGLGRNQGWGLRADNPTATSLTSKNIVLRTRATLNLQHACGAKMSLTLNEPV